MSAGSSIKSWSSVVASISVVLEASSWLGKTGDAFLASKLGDGRLFSARYRCMALAWRCIMSASSRILEGLAAMLEDFARTTC